MDGRRGDGLDRSDVVDDVVREAEGHAHDDPGHDPRRQRGDRRFRPRAGLAGARRARVDAARPDSADLSGSFRLTGVGVS